MHIQYLQMPLDDELPHQRTLRELTPYLIDNVRYRDVHDYIYAEGFLSLDEIEVIEEDRGERMRTRLLLRVLIQKPEGAFKSFINALTETSTHHVVDTLEKKLAAIQQESTNQQHSTHSEYKKHIIKSYPYSTIILSSLTYNSYG